MTAVLLEFALEIDWSAGLEDDFAKVVSVDVSDVTDGPGHTHVIKAIDSAGFVDLVVAMLRDADPDRVFE